MARLNILHLSDFHAGQKGLDSQWRNGYEATIETDVRRWIGTHDPIDLVLFTGDLAFKGHADEYKTCSQVINKILDYAGGDTRPVFLAVPGNHDLAAPPEAERKVLWDKIQANLASAQDRENFWEKDDGLRGQLAQMFGNYRDWALGAPLNTGMFGQAKEQPNVELKWGLCPGDFMATVTIRGFKIGVVGLNSALVHLPLDGVDCNLDVSGRQLRELHKGQSIHDWAQQHHFRFLLTHHPKESLSSTAQENWNNIYRPDIFQMHLFGHRHKGQGETCQINGERHVRQQGYSLFGLENWGKEEESRLHGHFFMGLDYERRASTAQLRLYPRMEHKGRIIPDYLHWKLKEPDNYDAATIPDVNCRDDQVAAHPGPAALLLVSSDRPAETQVPTAEIVLCGTHRLDVQLPPRADDEAAQAELRARLDDWPWRYQKAALRVSAVAPLSICFQLGIELQRVRNLTLYGAGQQKVEIAPNFETYDEPQAAFNSTIIPGPPGPDVGLFVNLLPNRSLVPFGPAQQRIICLNRKTSGQVEPHEYQALAAGVLITMVQHQKVWQKAAPGQTLTWHLAICSPAQFAILLGRELGQRAAKIKLYEFDREAKTYKLGFETLPPA